MNINESFALWTIGPDRRLLGPRRKQAGNQRVPQPPDTPAPMPLWDADAAALWDAATMPRSEDIVVGQSSMDADGVALTPHPPFDLTPSIPLPLDNAGPQRPKEIEGEGESDSSLFRLDKVIASPSEGSIPVSTGAVEDGRRPSRMPVLLEAARPRQWTKNLLLFGGLLFTSNLFRLGPLLQTLAAFACFCVLSSAVYLWNDIMDRERDLAHPRKRLRPIASGRLSPERAAWTAGVLGVLGLGGSFLINIPFGLLAVAFLVLNLGYSLWLKHEVIVDILCIAAGFLLRALAGAVAIQVPISPWLLVCTTLLALVIGFGKRRQELNSLDAATAHRRVLQHYSPAFLDQLISSVTAATLVAYLFYAFQSETARFHSGIPATIPFVMYGLFRYLYLMHQRNLGGEPEELLFRDWPLLIAVIGWGITAAVAMALP